MYNRIALSFLALLVLGGTAMPIQSAVAQWRTHYVRRDGLIHVEKYRTGNGLTPVGGAVLMTGITEFAPVVAGAIGREAPESRDAGARNLAFPPEYLEESKKARELLSATARLVGNQPPASGSTPPAVVLPGVRPPKPPGVDPWGLTP